MHMKTMTALACALATALLAGCAGNQPKAANADEASSYQAQLQQERTRNEDLQQQLAAKNTATPAAPNDDLFPPNAKPGECYARVLIPAKFENASEQVKVRDASEKIDVVPAQYQWTEKQVVDKEASTRLEVVPATYETTTENVMVSPDSKKLVTVPAKYSTTEDQVVDVPAHTIWKRGTSTIPGAINTKVDQSTGEIMCLVDVPATYKTIKKTVLAQPASVTEVDIPAVYKTVTKTVVKTPPTTRTVDIPATYKTVRVQELVSAATENRTPIPAEYKTVTSSKKVTDEQMAWRRVVCETNMTPGLAKELQTALAGKSYYHGPIDSIFGPQTMAAASHYAKDNGLPSGTRYVSYDVLKSLGVNQ